MIYKHKPDVQNEFRGGKGSITLNHFLDMEKAHGAGRLFALTVIPPACSIGLHKHEGDSEVYYILEGKALVNDNGKNIELNPGDCNFCPDGSSHSIENIGTTDLKYIAVILYTNQKKV